METHEQDIEIEVVYAVPQRQVLKRLRVGPQTTAEQAVELSGIRSLFPEIRPFSQQTGHIWQVRQPGYYPAGSRPRRNISTPNQRPEGEPAAAGGKISEYAKALIRSQGLYTVGELRPSRLPPRPGEGLLGIGPQATLEDGEMG